MPRNAEPKDLRQRLEGTGFFILAEVPDQKLVIGVAGRFWRPDGGRRSLERKNVARYYLLMPSHEERCSH